jgi:hypothetical protein
VSRACKKFPTETNQPVAAILCGTEHKIVALKAGDCRLKVVAVQVWKIRADEQGAAVRALAQQELAFHPAAQVAAPL